MADYNLGTARGRIEVDASGVGRGLRDANNELDTLQRRSSDASTGMLMAGGAMVTGAAAIAGGFAVAVNAAANYEQRLSAIQAVSGATGDEMELLSEKALQLGADTKFSATESASAMEELIKAGLSVEDVLNGAADATVNLAAAGEVDLVTAATMAANAMNAFNLEASEMPHVADLIAGAANASAIDVGEFGMAMQQSAAVANLAGLSFDDLAVAIAAMGNAGIRGSDAGTSLKTFLQNLQPVTQRQIDLFTELGIVTEDGTNAFYDQAGQLRPLSEVAQVLQDSLVGMTDAQKQMALETMFGSDAIRAAAIIADEGAAGFEELAGAMGNVTAAEVAETRMDNLAGSIEMLKGSFETLLIQIGAPLLGGVRAVVDAISGLVGWISQLDEGTLDIITTVGLMVAAFSGVVGSILLVAGAIGKVTLAMNLLKLAFLAHPIGILIAAAVALGAALFVLYQRNESFREAVQRAWQWIKDNVIPILQEVGRVALQAFQDAVAWIQANVLPVLQRIGEIFVQDVIPAFQDFVDFILSDVVPVFEEIIGAVIWLASEIQERLGSAFGWLQDHVFPILTELFALFQALADRVVQVGGIVGSVLNRMGFLWTGIGTAVQNALTIARNAIQLFINVVSIIWRNFGDNIFRMVDFVWGQIQRVVEAALRVIQGIIQTVTGIISGDWSKAWEGIRNIFGGIWDYISGIPAMVLGAIQLVIQNFLDWILTAWQVAWELVKSVLGTAWEVMKNTVSTGINNVIGFVAGMPGRILGALGNLISLLWQKGVDLIQGFWNGIKNIFEQVKNWFLNLPGTIISALGDVGSILLQAGKDLIQGFIDGIRDMFGAVADTLGGLTDSLTSWKGPPAKDEVILVRSGELVMEGFMQGLMNKIPAIRSMLQGIAPAIQSTVESNINSVAPTAALSATGTDGPVNVELVFNGPYGPDFPSELRATLNDDTVLDKLVSAVRAGTGRRR